MRTLVLILCFILAALPMAAGTTVLHISRDDDGDSYAKWERNGVRYITRDESVLDAIDKALEYKQGLSREHSALGRRHTALGREHARLGREHARLGRGERNEERQRELEAEMRRLEQKQRDLESERRQLETKRNAAARELDDAMDELFERAVREGKATRR